MPQQVAQHTPFARAGVIGVLLSLLVTLIVMAFAWPAVTADPKDLPVAFVGSGAQAEELSSTIEDHADGAVKLQDYDSRADAVRAIEQRTVYGGIVLGSDGEAPEVLTASAANATTAQLLQSMATQLQTQINASIIEQVERAVPEAIAQAAQAAVAAAQSGQAPASSGEPFTIPTVTVTVTDVVPLADSDPRGTGLIAAMFPLVLGGIVGGVVLSFVIAGPIRRVFAVIVYSAAAGLVIGGVMQGWFGALQGSYWLNAGAIALSVAAISATVTGLNGLIGRAGIGVGAVLMMFIGNPLSAATMPIEFIVKPWGAVGQWFPPGAAATLIRDLSYFPDASTLQAWLVLAGWTIAGLLLSLIAHARGRRAPQHALDSDSDSETIVAAA